MKFKERPIREICSVQAGYPFRCPLTDFPRGDVRVVQPKDVQANAAIELGKLVSLDLPQVKPEQALKAGDIVFVNRGKFSAAVIEEHVPGAVVGSNSVLSLTARRDMVMPEYLVFYFNSKAGQAVFDQVGQTSTVPFISKVNLEQLSVPVPTLERQRELVELGRLSQEYVRLSRRKIELLDNIMSHEFTGAHVPEDL